VLAEAVDGAVGDAAAARLLRARGEHVEEVHLGVGEAAAGKPAKSWDRQSIEMISVTPGQSSPQTSSPLSKQFQEHYQIGELEYCCANGFVGNFSIVSLKPGQSVHPAIGYQSWKTSVYFPSR
jgi:hypothetical protein